MKTKISRWGNSAAIRFPKNLLEELGIQEGTTVEIIAREGKIIIPSPKNRYKLGDLLEKITPENKHHEVDNGRAIGQEIW